MVLFSEDHIQETKRRGRIEVICGSMFSGKTEELIRRLKRAKFAKQRVEIYKPAIDTRYSEADVVSHDSNIISSTPIDSSASILLFTSEIDVVGIDEAQFFDEGLIDVCNQLANSKRLINLIQDSMERKKITFDSFIRGVILGVIIIGILMFLKRLSSVLLPFFIAWLIAYLVYPLVTFFQYKLKLRNRIVSIFCALLTLLIVGAGTFYLLVPPMIQACGRVQTLLVQYFSHGTYNSNVPTSLSDYLRDNIDVKFITELFNKENLLDALKEAVPRLWSLLSDSVDLLFSVFTIFIIRLRKHRRRLDASRAYEIPLFRGRHTK